MVAVLKAEKDRFAIVLKGRGFQPRRKMSGMTVGFYSRWEISPLKSSFKAAGPRLPYATRAALHQPPQQSRQAKSNRIQNAVRSRHLRDRQHLALQEIPDRICPRKHHPPKNGAGRHLQQDPRRSIVRFLPT